MTTVLVLMTALTLLVIGSLGEGSRSPGPVDAVRAALETWERFATTGDQASLDEVFAPDGPQHARLEAEAAVRAAGGGFASPRLSLSGTEAVETDAATAAVDARVVIALDGEHTAVWRFHLVRRAGTWRVWSVEEIAAP